MSRHPYTSLPDISFWKTGVVKSKDATPPDLYKNKWPITRDDLIATAGSCFAQHIGRNLKNHGFTVIDKEPPPSSLATDDHLKFGYSIYSARHGNIYTIRQLLQLSKEAFGLINHDNIVWEKKHGFFVDALRPGIEPKGLSSPEEVLVHRKYHVQIVREVFETMDLMFFTLGLTEAWVHKSTGTVYPTAPGTIAGHYDPDIFVLKNFNYQDVVSDFIEFRNLVHNNQKKKCRFILTVSPVPLAATATNNHVMVATVYSKSVLRAAAGFLSDQFFDVDYFPSYEIITNPWNNISFYDKNLRSVTSAGVDEVMSIFFQAHLDEPYVLQKDIPNVAENQVFLRNIDDDILCEEAILSSFAGGKG